MKYNILITSILIAVFSGLIMYLLFDTNTIDDKIQELNRQNDSLRIVNNMIFSKINEYQVQLEDANKKITELKDIDANYQYIIKDINKKMTDLKSQYEKANNHSSNFTSTDIQRYFSDLR